MMLWSACNLSSFWVYRYHSPSRRGRTTLEEGTGGPRGGRVASGARAEEGEQLTGRAQASREPRGCPPPAADWGGWLKHKHTHSFTVALKVLIFCTNIWIWPKIKQQYNNKQIKNKPKYIFVHSSTTIVCFLEYKLLFNALRSFSMFEVRICPFTTKKVNPDSSMVIWSWGTSALLISINGIKWPSDAS